MKSLLFIRNSYEKIMPGQGDYKTMSGDDFYAGKPKKIYKIEYNPKVKKLSINTEAFLSSMVLHVALTAKNVKCVCKSSIWIQLDTDAVLQKFAKFLRRTFWPAWSRIPLTNLIHRSVRVTVY
jgi:hypothetical protein